MSTPVETFAGLLAASDVLFSPIFDWDCIVAPPLTWIESMAAGLPVLTTDVPGADELVESGRTGYLAKDDTEIITKLFSLRDEHATSRVFATRRWPLTTTSIPFGRHT